MDKLEENLPQFTCDTISQEIFDMLYIMRLKLLSKFIEKICYISHVYKPPKQKHNKHIVMKIKIHTGNNNDIKPYG